jgi:uncharacterized protein (DUF1697 family)
MTELVALCKRAGLADAKTYIQSGNVAFTSALDEAALVAALGAALEKKLKKPVGVMVRTAAQLADVIARSPFPDVPGNQLLIAFLSDAPPPDSLAGWPTPGGERLVLDGRHVYIHFPDGQGASKLKIPFADRATLRNLNTTSKMLELATALQPAP